MNGGRNGSNGSTLPVPHVPPDKPTPTPISARVRTGLGNSRVAEVDAAQGHLALGAVPVEERPAIHRPDPECHAMAFCDLELLYL